MATLLLIDDDTEVLASNQKYFNGRGFKTVVTDKPKEASALIKKVHPDCVLLDIMMPEMNGMEVCKEIRSFSSVPIIFLTGKDSEKDLITGLMTGADDYIVKPYSLKEVEARIIVLLRRSAQLKATINANKNVLVFNELKIDKLEHKAYFRGEDLQLPNKEYTILSILAAHPNEEITFEQLGKALLGNYTENDRRVIMVNVSRLRKRMSIDPDLLKMIDTVWSKGYIFRTE